MENTIDFRAEIINYLDAIIRAHYAVLGFRGACKTNSELFKYWNSTFHRFPITVFV